MFLQNDFSLLKNKIHLLRALGIDETTFDQIIAFNPDEEEQFGYSAEGFRIIGASHFIKHEIQKKNRDRGARVVWEPTYSMKIYKSLARRLNEFFRHKLGRFPHPQTFGFIGGRNIRENASQHCGRRYILSVDIEDFFPSIQMSRIAGYLVEYGFEPYVADLLSKFVTIGGKLPLGFPTSPTISNAICLPLDDHLTEIAGKYDATVSRYADDISFSSDTDLPPLDDVKKLIQLHGFQVADSKTRISKLGQAHYVTGLSISDRKQPHVPRQKKRRLRQELHYALKYGVDDHFQHLGISDEQMIQKEINRIDGLIKFTAFHEPRLSSTLKTTWSRILQQSGYSPSFEPKNQSQIPFCIYVDEAEYAHPDGRSILAICMAVSQHQDRIEQAVHEVINDTLADMYATGSRNALLKSGLHFAEAHLDLRKTFIERMRSLPFEGYVAMASLPNPDDYEATYLRLLNTMLKRRLMAAESQSAYFVFEINSKVSENVIRTAVKCAYRALKEENNRRPMHCGVTFSGKPNYGLSIPDFLLGSLGRFLISSPDTRESHPNRDRKLFESLRDKYRLILDVDNMVEYSRRRDIASWSKQ